MLVIVVVLLLLHSVFWYYTKQILIFREEAIDKIRVWGYAVVMVYLGLCQLASIPLIMGASNLNLLIIKYFMGI